MYIMQMDYIGLNLFDLFNKTLGGPLRCKSMPIKEAGH